MECPPMSLPLTLTQTESHTQSSSPAGDTLCCTNWLKVFDQLHHLNHIKSWTTDKCGVFAHIHIGSHKAHETVHAPPGLPVNAYDSRWLESRETLYLRHMLCPQEELYDFSHPPDVIAYVCLIILTFNNLSSIFLDS